MDPSLLVILCQCRQLRSHAAGYVFLSWYLSPDSQQTDLGLSLGMDLMPCNECYYFHKQYVSIYFPAYIALLKWVLWYLLSRTSNMPLCAWTSSYEGDESALEFQYWDSDPVRWRNLIPIDLLKHMNPKVLIEKFLKQWPGEEMYGWNRELVSCDLVWPIIHMMLQMSFMAAITCYIHHFWNRGLGDFHGVSISISAG